MKTTLLTILILIFINLSTVQATYTGKWTKIETDTFPGLSFNFNQLFKYDNEKLLLRLGKDENYWFYFIEEQRWEEVVVEEQELRYRHSFAVSTDQKLVNFGSNSWSFDDSLYIYDVLERKIEILINPNDTSETSEISWPEGRDLSMIFHLGNDKFIVFGGYKYIYTHEAYYIDFWIYDLKENLWTRIDKEPIDLNPIAGIDYDVVLLDENRLLFTGGEKNDIYLQSYYNEVWIFDIAKVKFTKLENSSQSAPFLKRNAFTKISDNLAILFGGQEIFDGKDDELLFVFSDETWIIDIENDEMSKVVVDNKPPAAWYHTICQIGDGKAIMYGGRDSSGAILETWLFELDLVSVEDEQVDKNTFSTQYNHTTAKLHIQPDFEIIGNYTIKIYDILGRNVLTHSKQIQNNGKSEIILDASKIHPGAYFVNIILSDKLIHSQFYKY